MTKQIALVLIIVLRAIYQPSQDQDKLSPFASPSPLPASTITAVPAKIIHTNAASSDRLILKWIIGDNRPADCFQSVNEFYEKRGNQPILPCIQLLNKKEYNG